MIRRWTKCRASLSCRPPNRWWIVRSGGEVSYHRRFTIWSGGEATIVRIESKSFVWMEALIRPTNHRLLPHGWPIVPLSLFVCKPCITLPPDPKTRYAFTLQWWILVGLFSSLSLVWMLSYSSQSTYAEVDCYII
jgi:hypothetical protein